MTQIDPRVVSWRRQLRADGRVELGERRRWPRRRPTVVIDANGVWIRPGIVRVPWADVVEVTVLDVNEAPDIVELAVTREFHSRWLAAQNWFVRLMWVLEEIWRPDAARLRLPGVRPRDGRALGAFLRHEAERRADLRPGRSPR